MEWHVIDGWITDNMLDSEAWVKADEQKQMVAVKQAVRNLSRWYPDVELTAEIVSYQAIWELQGIDPVLKYQKHNVKSLMDSGEVVSYKDVERPAVAPDITELLGQPTGGSESGSYLQYGGILL